MTWDLKPIIDLGIAYNPNLAVADMGVPRSWLNQGCDPEKDCVPAMERVIAWARRKGKVIHCYSYFTLAVLEERDRRMAAPKPKPEQADVDARKAKNIAWARDKGIKCVGIGPAEFRWLEEYEQRHGTMERSRATQASTQGYRTIKP